ncbi:MAG: PepSY-associated TM helix domain-containing protein [Bacteroidota bacterium]
MKKLTGLGNRTYNVMFHTHTVAGIVISFALFVIFYAGAFSLFRHEMFQWENPSARIAVDEHMDYDLALAKVDSVYNLDWHSITNVVFPNEHYPFLQVYGAVKVNDTTTERMAAYVEPGTYRVQDMREPLTTVGTTLYFLHYFRQIPVIGLYLSGLVGLFFLFATVTGVLIHWRNLFTKFYAFVREGKWKTIWTNAHTVLGIMGLPLHLIYGITGAFFGLLNLILLPSVLLLFDGDTSKVFNMIRPEDAIEVAEDAPRTQHKPLMTYMADIQEQFPGYTITRLKVRNLDRQDALATWGIDDHKGILSSGLLTMHLADGKVMEEISTIPYEKAYSQSIIDLITKLHFGDFGGILIKIVYFVLSILTCFMIITGVLIWQTARDNPRYTDKQRQFHHRVTKVYLAICLSMFPAFALIFLANKSIPMDLAGRVDWVNGIFFGGWLLLTLMGLRWNRYAVLNKNYLNIGGLMSLLVPVFNGMATGDWFWMTWNSTSWVAYVDLFWLGSGVVALYLAFFVLKDSYPPKMPPKRAQKAKPATKSIHPKETVVEKNPKKVPVFRFNFLRG